MKKRTICTVFALLFLAYNLVVIKRLNRFRVPAPNQWLAIPVAVQRYLYARRPPKVVLVGSSVTARLGNLGSPDVFPLAMAGQSARTGLAILERSEQQPETVLVELNLAATPANDTLLAEIFHPVWEPIRRHILSQRAENRPIDFFFYPATFLYLTVMDAHKSSLEIVPSPGGQRNGPQTTGSGSGGPSEKKDQGEPAKNQKRTSQVTEFVRAEHAVAPAEKALREAAEDLRRRIEQLRARKIRVILFEVPVPPELYESPRYQMERKFLRGSFPEEQICRDFRSDDLSFPDGYHLDAASAAVVARHFLSELERLKRPAR